MSEPAAVSVKDVSLTFSDGPNDLKVLDDISFDVPAGSFTSIVGSSGSGKSTLLRVIAGLYKPNSGSVTLPAGQLGFVFQNFGLFPWLTTEQNIEFGLKMNKVNKAERGERVAKIISEVGLKGFARSHPSELSGGMKQRVGLARALVLKPSVLLLDEPFSALDEVTAETLRDELLELWQASGTTIIMVTHLAEEAVQLSDQILIFSPRPARIIKRINNDLKRPRQTRQQDFYKLVDQIKAGLKED